MRKTEGSFMRLVALTVGGFHMSNEAKERIAFHSRGQENVFDES
jgi:hypothetical protein